MPRSKAKAPIESFGPELMAILQRGARERLVVELPSSAAAHSLRRRIHTLRARLRDADDDRYLVASKVRLSILYGALAVPFANPAMKYKLIAQPHDAQFRAAIEAAGVNIDDSLVDVAPHDPMNESIPSEGTLDSTAPPLDGTEFDILDRYRKG